MFSSLLQSHFKWWFLAPSKTSNMSVVFRRGAVVQHAEPNPAQTPVEFQLKPGTGATHSSPMPLQTCPA